ncbi:MAG: LOG family protein [Anaerolineaceae bacterium]
MSENKRQIQTICVYCGSADGLKSEFYQSAYQTGKILAERHINIVYGAGKTGLMGAVADGALDAGGKVIGIVPENLNEPQLIHAHLSELQVVPNIQLRKARMSEIADAFIALPGGFGTFDELFETLTWAQIGLHKKPIGILNILNYFDPLLTMVNHALQEKFIYDEHKILLVSEEDPIKLFEKLVSFQRPENLNRWISRDKN